MMVRSSVALSFKGRKTRASLPAPSRVSLERDLGHLEQTILETLWTRGEGNVRDVVGWLDQPLAYNTVMTTLDRLYKKGLLDRAKQERAFFYTPRFTRREWQRSQAEQLVSGFLAGSGDAGELMVSCLVDAVGQHDEALLEELEARIKAKRRELDQARQS